MSNKLNNLKTFHAAALRLFLNADRSTPNAVLYLEFACPNITIMCI